MKLTKRARDGIWLVEYRDPDGRRQRKSTGCRERDNAEREAYRLLAGIGRKEGRYTIGDALDRAWERRWATQKGAREWGYVVNAVRRRFGRLDCGDVTYTVLDEWVSEMQQEGKAPATIGHYLTAMSVALGEAAKRGYIAGVPPMPRPKVRNAKLRWITEDEERALVGCALGTDDGPLMAALIHLLLDTGARLGEIIRLRPEHVRADAVMLIDTKSGGSRTVPLTARARLSLREILADPTWQSVCAGVHESATRKGSAKDFAVKRFTTVRNMAGLPDVSLHTLRHTCASRLVQRGVDLYKVKTWMGHSTIRMTERYAHLAPSALADLAAVLEPKATATVVNINDRR